MRGRERERQELRHRARQRDSGLRRQIDPSDLQRTRENVKAVDKVAAGADGGQVGQRRVHERLNKDHPVQVIDALNVLLSPTSAEIEAIRQSNSVICNRSDLLQLDAYGVKGWARQIRLDRRGVARDLCRRSD